MTALEKFKKGDRVRASQKGIDHGCFRTIWKEPKLDGVVVGFGQRTNLVRVKRDGEVATGTYHMDFWDVVQ